MKKLLFIAIVIIALGISLYQLSSQDRFSFIPEQESIIETLTFGNFLKANYSFSSDADFDGLSDAKEIIYGSDPLNSDTDGDGFLDGKEVAEGFDPLVAGEGTGRLSERQNPSLTIQYFSWLQGKTGNPNPPLEQPRIHAFLTERGLLDFSLPLILDSEIIFTNDDLQKIADYVSFTTTLTLPEEGSPYLALAGELIKNRSFASLTNLVKNVQKGVEELQKIPVPAKAKELHRHYLGIWKELQTIFEGLKRAQEDPLLIYLNQKKGEWLAQEIKEVEKLRAELIAQVKLLPFNPQPEQQP